MLPEVTLLKYLLNYKSFKEYRSYVEVSKELHEIKKLYYVLDILHEKYPDTDKTVDELAMMASICYPQMREAEKEALTIIINQLREVSVRDEIVHDLLSNVSARSKAHALALAALEVSEGRREASSLSELAASVCSPKPLETENFEKYFVTDDLESLGNSVVHSSGYSWPMACLRRSLGPLRPGDFGFVFARPETGKTTFLAHSATCMAKQTEGPVVWFNNEEQGEKVRLRTYQAALGCTLEKLWSNKEENLRQYRDLTRGQLFIYDDANIYKKDVEKVVDKLKPSIIIFDQIDKIRGFDADRPDLVYGRIYQWARELAKVHRCAVIGVCQAGSAGEGVRWLNMGHVAEAHTSKQAEADWILGIGRSNEGGTEDVRYFNISKNKLLGDEQTDPNERHGRFQVFIRPTLARFEDLD